MELADCVPQLLHERSKRVRFVDRQLPVIAQQICDFANQFDGRSGVSRDERGEQFLAVIRKGFVQPAVDDLLESEIGL